MYRNIIWSIIIIATVLLIGEIKDAYVFKNISDKLNELERKIESLTEDVDVQIYMICENRKAIKGVKYHSMCKYELSRLYFKLLDKMWEKRSCQIKKMEPSTSVK
jgi:hypothetical protein